VDGIQNKFLKNELENKGGSGLVPMENVDPPFMI
jgi:hypothetical protein